MRVFLEPGSDAGTRGGGRRRYLGVAAVVAVLILAVLGTACTSSKGELQWTGNYFKNPDLVWNAIELTLIELDYDVTAENREDGTIRAETDASENGAVIVLTIDQVMRTEPQVNVYVKPSFASAGPGTDPDLLKAAGDAFMKGLDAKLNP